MKKLILLSFLIIVGIGWSEVESVEPYISPGLQIGFNSNKEFFYGFQLSAGIIIDSKDNFVKSPSICYGYKKIFNSKLNEQYIDVQMTVIKDSIADFFPIGFGLGMDLSGDKNITRIKGYSWLFSCITLDYNIKRKLFNTSLIPVLPIAAMM